MRTALAIFFLLVVTPLTVLAPRLFVENNLSELVEEEVPGSSHSGNESLKEYLFSCDFSNHGRQVSYARIIGIRFAQFAESYDSHHFFEIHLPPPDAKA